MTNIPQPDGEPQLSRFESAVKNQFDTQHMAIDLCLKLSDPAKELMDLATRTSESWHPVWGDSNLSRVSQALITIGALEKAEAVLLLIKRDMLDRQYCYHLLGHAALKSGNSEKAKYYFQQALRQIPDGPDIDNGYTQRDSAAFISWKEEYRKEYEQLLGEALE